MSTASLRLDSELVARAKIIGSAQSRSTAKQIEHWAKIGKIMEANPDLPYSFVQEALIAQAEKEAGDLEEYKFG
ncbi:MAG: ParD-like family protein [Rhodospirillales bacterium]|nr:ParD-like family protein [Rhodospirillales bacterium]